MKKHFKVWLSIVAIALIGVGVVVGYQLIHSESTMETTTHSETKKKTEYKKQVRLVALGDSLTQGVGDQDNNGGYVGIVKKSIQKKYNTKVTTSNYGVAGDRSDQILKRLNNETKVQNNLKNADVIVMTVGGNDLMQALEKNAFVSSQSKFSNKMSSAETTYDSKLKELLTTVRKYNHDSPIFLFSVYNPFYVYFANVDSINQSVSEFNETSKTTLKNYGPAYFVDVDDLMSHGQYKTKSQQQKLVEQAKKDNDGTASQKQINSIMSKQGTNLNNYISPDDNFHPNHLGYEQMTKKLFASMQKHSSWIVKEH